MYGPCYPGPLQWLSVLFFLPVVDYPLFGPAGQDNPTHPLVHAGTTLNPVPTLNPLASI